MSSSSAPAQAPSNGMSLAEETSMSQLRQRLQRDINGLSDQDRTTRRRALTKLQQVFFRESKVGRRTKKRGSHLLGGLQNARYSGIFGTALRAVFRWTRCTVMKRVPQQKIHQLRLYMLTLYICARVVNTSRKVVPETTQGDAKRRKINGD